MINYLKGCQRSTPIGMLPEIITHNNQAITNEFNWIFDSSLNRLTKSVYVPTGSVKAYFGEFTNLACEYLTIKNTDSLVPSLQKAVDKIISVDVSMHNTWAGRYADPNLEEKYWSNYSHDAGTIIYDDSGRTIVDYINDSLNTKQNILIPDYNTISIDNSSNIKAKGYRYTNEPYYQFIIADTSKDGNGKYAIVEGKENYTNGDYSHIEGINNVIDVSGYYAHVEGSNNKANAVSSHAEGDSNEILAIANYAHAEGLNNIIHTECSHAEGSNNIIIGKDSHAEGNENKVLSECSHVEGNLTISYGDYSHAEGDNTAATSIATHAEGTNCIAAGKYSHAEGYNTYAEGEASHTSGIYTYAKGKASFAEGEGEYISLSSNKLDYEEISMIIETNYKCINIISSETFDSKNVNILELYYNDNKNILLPILNYECEQKDNKYLHKFVLNCQNINAIIINDVSTFQCYTMKYGAIGDYSHAEGYKTIANGRASHVEGEGTIANNDYQFVIGKYNNTDSIDDKIFVIGNGTEENRTNIFSVDNDGDLEFKSFDVSTKEGTDTTINTITTLVNYIKELENRIKILENSQSESLEDIRKALETVMYNNKEHKK